MPVRSGFGAGYLDFTQRLLAEGTAEPARSVRGRMKVIGLGLRM
jgi:hypothetical protein